MILTMFTVRGPSHYHQIHRTVESDDLKELIRIGNEWQNDELKQYYNIGLGKEDAIKKMA
jgi:hypothetical protein